MVGRNAVGLGLACVGAAEIFLDGFDHLAAGFELRQHFFRKAAAKTLFERRQNLHAFQRIEPQLDDARIERQPACPFLGDAMHFVQNLFGDGLVDFRLALGNRFGLLHGRRLFRCAGRHCGQRRLTGRSGSARGAGASKVRASLAVSPAVSRSASVATPVETRDLFQHAFQIGFTAGVALNLAAGGLGNAAGFDEHDRIDLQFVLAAHVSTDGLENFLYFVLLATFDLVDDDQLRLIGHVDREGSPAAGPHRVVRFFDGELDVVRIVIQSADDDQVFQTAGDKQLAVLKESQVAGAQKRTVAVVAQTGAEGVLGLFGPPPVALGDAGAFDPDLADLPRTTTAHRLRIGDHDLFVGQDLAAADERSRVGVDRPEFDHSPVFQRLGVERPTTGAAAFNPPETISVASAKP